MGATRPGQRAMPSTPSTPHALAPHHPGHTPSLPGSQPPVTADPSWPRRTRTCRATQRPAQPIRRPQPVASRPQPVRPRGTHAPPRALRPRPDAASGARGLWLCYVCEEGRREACCGSVRDQGLRAREWPRPVLGRRQRVNHDDKPPGPRRVLARADARRTSPVSPSPPVAHAGAAPRGSAGRGDESRVVVCVGPAGGAGLSLTTWGRPGSGASLSLARPGSRRARATRGPCGTSAARRRRPRPAAHPHTHTHTVAARRAAAPSNAFRRFPVLLRHSPPTRHGAAGAAWVAHPCSRAGSSASRSRLRQAVCRRAGHGLAIRIANKPPDGFREATETNGRAIKSRVGCEHRRIPGSEHKPVTRDRQRDPHRQAVTG